MTGTTRDIAISDIEVGDRLRVADRDWVGELMKSIEINGLLQPLVVRAIRRKGQRPFALLAGMHRLAACTSLGFQAVACRVVDADDQQAMLIEIDENIAHHELNYMDRAVALVERQGIYEALHPETKAGGDRKSADYLEKNQTGNIPVWSFAKDAAEKTGLDASSIRRSTRLAKGLKPATRARLAGTDLANNGAALTAISKLQDHEQAGVLDRMLRDEAPMGRVSDALADYEGRTLGRPRTADEKLIASFKNTWNRAGVKTRRTIIALINEFDVEDMPPDEAEENGA